MAIDWFTFAAQVVNFLILMGLLWRFLFRPILKVMNERERDIAASLSTAAEKDRQAGDELAALQAERAEFEGLRHKRLADLETEAAAMSLQLREAAKNEVDVQKQQWLETFAQHRAGLATQFQEELAALICAATRSALTDLADQPLESQMIEKFSSALEHLEPKELRQLRRSAVRDAAGVTVRTAFEVSGEQKTRLTNELHELIPDAPAPRFERCADGICGIELNAGDRRIAWNFASYLEALHRDLGRVEEMESSPTPVIAETVDT